MLLLSPELTRFDNLTLDDVASIAIDTGAARIIADFSDLGPHLAFADAPEKRTTIRIERTLRRAEIANDPSAHIGRRGTLLFHTNPADTGDAHQSRITIHCILTNVKTTPSNNPRLTHQQTLTFLALSPDGGATNPITIATAD